MRNEVRLIVDGVVTACAVSDEDYAVLIELQPGHDPVENEARRILRHDYACQIVANGRYIITGGPYHALSRPKRQQR